MATKYQHIQRINDTAAFFEITWTDHKNAVFTTRYDPRPKDFPDQMRYADECLEKGKPQDEPAIVEPPVVNDPPVNDTPVNDPPQPEVIG